MANKSCQACQDLQNDAPGLIVNGMTETECTSLMNDTGLNPSSGNNDCTDLNNMNDCLIGNLEPELESYDVCDWKEFTGHFVDNTWTVFKGVICAICGLWTKLHALCSSLNKTAYVGVMTIYTNSGSNESTGTGDGVKTVVLPFEQNHIDGNLPSGLFTASGTSIVVSNITDVPLLIESTYNCSLRTSQRIASCYLTITRDGLAVGQTPFITPTTYDQQVAAEPFILQPGQSATMAYYFGVGAANAWYHDTFGLRGGESSAYVHAKHEPRNTADPENQRSYFNVKATSMMPTISC